MKHVKKEVSMIFSHSENATTIPFQNKIEGCDFLSFTYCGGVDAILVNDVKKVLV